MNAAERQRPPAGELCLDHLAHFVPDLGAAAKVLENLGFKVTPEAAHRAQGAPAGTSNRCVMLEEGYLELLAPTLDTPNAQRVRDAMQRFVGVHLACFGTPDAAAERRRLADHGFEPEPLVNLERSVEGGGLARFNVIYVPPGRMAEGRVQYVEQLTPEHVWQEGFVNPFRLTGVYVVARDPAQTAARWARFAGLLPRPQGELVNLECARGRVVIGTPRTLSALLGELPPAPALAGYALACGHPEALAARCSDHGMAVRKTAEGYSVSLPAVLGGAWLLSGRSSPADG